MTYEQLEGFLDGLLEQPVKKDTQYEQGWKDALKCIRKYVQDHGGLQTPGTLPYINVPYINAPYVPPNIQWTCGPDSSGWKQSDDISTK